MAKNTNAVSKHPFDAYLAGVEEPYRTALVRLWHVIKQAAPEAQELISYQVPTFKQQGMLVAFAAAKSHCGFYVMSPPLMKAMAEELKGYDISTATIRFKPEKPLPVALVKKIVKARLKENEARALAKKK